MNKTSETKKEYIRNYKKVNASKINAQNKEYRRKNKEKVKLWNRRQIIRRKTLLLEKFGKCCAGCGFDDPRALQIDHINKIGSKEINEYRKSFGGLNRYYKYLLEEAIKSEYQTLCANCNWRKSLVTFPRNPSDYRTLRDKVLEKFNNKCSSCNLQDSLILQVDHVNGGGVKELQQKGAYAVLLLALKDTDNNYQLMCPNCNWIKRFVNDECSL